MLIGEISHENFVVNPEEVADIRWIDIPALNTDLQANPSHYTPWFAQAFDLAMIKLSSLNGARA